MLPIRMIAFDNYKIEFDDWHPIWWSSTELGFMFSFFFLLLLNKIRRFVQNKSILDRTKQEKRSDKVVRKEFSFPLCRLIRSWQNNKKIECWCFTFLHSCKELSLEEEDDGKNRCENAGIFDEWNIIGKASEKKPKQK